MSLYPWLSSPPRGGANPDAEIFRKRLSKVSPDLSVSSSRRPINEHWIWIPTKKAIINVSHFRTDKRPSKGNYLNPKQQYRLINSWSIISPWLSFTVAGEVPGNSLVWEASAEEKVVRRGGTQPPVPLAKPVWSWQLFSGLCFQD